jgi:dTDP-4-amino-4,6-dideoxygalactose transaminase
MEFRDLKTQYSTYKKEIDGAISEVLANADFISGSAVSILEKRLADYIGVKHCITCGNGTDAMSLVLMAWDIKEGDAVFVPDFTFFATAEVVALRGATPIFFDVDSNTFNMDFRDLEKKIIKTKNETNLSPKAIIPVDLFGLPANYDEIEKIATKFNLLILEDGAQGFGGSIRGKKACSFGHAATTSFFPAKPLGCYGDGGAIFTNSDELALLLRSYSVHGKGRDKYDNIRVGLNSRLDTLQAAILNIKLTAFINHELSDVNEIYKKYDKYLTNKVIKPYIPKGYESSFAQYTIKLKHSRERDSLKNHLNERNIPAMIYYGKPLHKQTAFYNFELSYDDNKISEELTQTVLSLPMHPYLSDSDIIKITKVVEGFFKK